jgi:lysophospholipase L1-like esterase
MNTNPNASTVASAGSDGLHFDEASHPALGELIAEAIRNLSKTVAVV